jgi:hypothetical protein
MHLRAVANLPRRTKIRAEDLGSTALRLIGQEARADALEARLESDRRLVGERVAEIVRWIFVTVIAVLNNFTTGVGGDEKVAVNGVLVVWVAANFAVTVLLLRGYQPGRQFGLSTIAMDIGAGSALVYFSAGFASPYFLALFVAIIASSIRLGTAASIATAGTIAVLYLFAGGAAAFERPVESAGEGLEVLGRVLLFLVVALISAAMARELVASRRRAIEWAAQAQSLHEVSAAMAISLQALVESLGQAASDALTSATRGDHSRIPTPLSATELDVVPALLHDLREPLLVLDSYLTLIRSGRLGPLPAVVEDAVPQLRARVRELDVILARVETTELRPADLVELREVGNTS